MGKKLQFLPSIHWIYKWVDPEVLGIPLRVTSDFLRLLKEENQITLKGKYEEDYVLAALHVNERVYYINHWRGPGLDLDVRHPHLQVWCLHPIY